MEKMNVTISENELAEFVKEFLGTCEPDESKATILALHGDLGAGKTTFVKALAKALGVAETVTSPTFTILKQYETEDSAWDYLLHMDAYRIDDTTELGPLGFEALLLQPRTLFCIEWAEKISEKLPSHLTVLTFVNTTDEVTRTIQVHKVM